MPRGIQSIEKSAWPSAAMPIRRPLARRTVQRLLLHLGISSHRLRTHCMCGVPPHSQFRTEVGRTRSMSHKKEFVLKGPPVGDIPQCSLGEYLVPKMRALPRDKPIQVDAETGAVQTVGELLALGVRLSEGLRRLGLQEDDVVGLICRNSFEASGVVLGTWLNGSVVAPLPGTMTVGEFKHILGITKPKLIFCEEEGFANASAASDQLSLSSKMILVGQAKNCHSASTCFQDVLVQTDVDSFKPKPVKSPSSQLVAILTSSGTSGLPKGVGLTHRNLIFQDMNLAALGILDPELSFLQISHFFWVTGVITYLWSLTSGMTRVLLKNTDVPDILRAIDRYKPGATLAAPLVVQSVATHPDFEKMDVSSVKKILMGGSPFVPSIGDKIKEAWPTVRLVQAYGTTEVSGVICSNTGGDPYALGPVSPGVQVKVVDPTTRESLRANSLGEIAIKTPGLMACYVGNEEAYRKAVDEDGWFHSGDLGYYDDAGQFYIVDRMKEMVKVTNMQVSPSEVENVILSVPGVVEASVTGVTHDGNVYELLAVVAKEKNSTVTEQDIHDQVASTLSDYKRLTAGVYFMESLPKTANGKINKSKLKSLAQSLYSGQ